MDIGGGANTSGCGGVNVSAVPQISRMRLRENLQHAEGGCVLNISVCAMCCKGGGHCGMCWGTCCPLVNTVLNTLVEVGELSVDAEVSVSVLLSV